MAFDFSTVAAKYAAYRPHYPAALVELLARAAPATTLAWDAGCGNGQLSVALATRFDRVIATDPSAAQIAEATRGPTIAYRVATSEDGIAETGVDLAVAAQAAHWFDWDRYVGAVRRATRPGAIAALVAYGRLTVPGGELVDEFYDRTVGSYWPPERAHIENHYRDLIWPWPAVDAPAIAMVEAWTREELLGYIATWSATNRYVAANGSAALETLASRLAAIWPDDERRSVSWPLVVKLARVT